MKLHLETLLAIVALAIAPTASACYTSGSASVAASAPISAELALIGPGVYVVEDYPSAVFFADGYYWRYDSGVWFRSFYYDGNFVRVNTAVVPRSVRRIDRPSRYRYFRARANARRRHIRAHRRAHRAHPRHRVRDKRHRPRHRVRDKRDHRRHRERDRREQRAERRHRHRRDM